MAIPVIAGALIKVAGPIIAAKIGQKLSKRETDDLTAGIVQQIVTEVTADPVVKNEMNAEAPIQSRVVVGSSSAVIGAIGILAPIVAKAAGIEIDTPRVVEIVSAVLVLWGPLYALYGRLTSGLKPLFSRK